MQSLRDLVRPVDPALASEIGYAIQSGAYARGEPRAVGRGRRHHAEKKSEALKIWQRVDWKAPGQTTPLKYSWQLVRPFVREDEVDEWPEIYRRDHPGVEFVASPTRPRAKRGPKIMKGPGMTHATRRHHATRSTEQRLVDAIRPGSRVTIVDRFGTQRTGRAVMRGPYGWILNMGGRHGTPGIATDDNVVRVKG
jgi:hypothetical protein